MRNLSADSLNIEMFNKRKDGFYNNALIIIIIKHFIIIISHSIIMKNWYRSVCMQIQYTKMCVCETFLVQLGFSHIIYIICAIG